MVLPFDLAFAYKDNSHIYGLISFNFFFFVKKKLLKCKIFVDFVEQLLRTSIVDR